MKPTRLLLILTTCLFAVSAFAQDREAGIFLGTSQYQGDLSRKQITLNETKPAFGILGRYYLNPRFDVKAGINIGWIDGSDKNYASTDYDRYKRNLSFHSGVQELTGQLEFNILPFISNSKRYRFAPYVFAGLSLYHFNPKADYQGKTYELQPLQTEGVSYHRLQGAIPVGIGLKFSLGNFWNLGLEVGSRKLFTDYLDDVSNKYPDLVALKATNPLAAALSNRSAEADPKFAGRDYSFGKRGDKSRNDLYIFAGFTITKTIRRFSCTGF